MAAGWTAHRIDRRIDLRGQVCPGPTVDTRLTLKEMAPGDSSVVSF